MNISLIKKELQNKEALRIKNKLLSDEYFEYYLTNSFEERSVKDYFNALLKFHPLILSSISLVGMICSFLYRQLFHFLSYFQVWSIQATMKIKKIKLGCFLGFPYFLFLH